VSSEKRFCWKIGGFDPLLAHVGKITLALFQIYDTIASK
jgi:hypothetical protein